MGEGKSGRWRRVGGGRRVTERTERKRRKLKGWRREKPGKEGNGTEKSGKKIKREEEEIENEGNGRWKGGGKGRDEN